MSEEALITQRLSGRDPLPDWAVRLDRTAFGVPWKAAADHEALWLVPGLAFARWACVPAAGEAELLRIAVDPAHRGGGLGRHLLEACQRDLAAEGMPHLFLEVRVSNAPAIRLYEACGWTLCGRRPGYYPDGEDALLFQRTS
ncbi:ribosomal-protein-alanine acetyltransferase [Geothrix limicola]|uniref:Ribosomal-protein-alanine acetyltransferase n=1 Tax=Geothrix limicola TaxID=2927978 RepID=A0ABQ5QDM1_9BACT|nr:GNAT family N-acetyltransferase [Geothrix limicola]GLH72663.1 ribosomal-protein-alanine acetyltransferase [Geothrix limicola]